jgi:hypothetical protein
MSAGGRDERGLAGEGSLLLALSITPDRAFVALHSHKHDSPRTTRPPQALHLREARADKRGQEVAYQGSLLNGREAALAAREKVSLEFLGGGRGRSWVCSFALNLRPSTLRTFTLPPHHNQINPQVLQEQGESVAAFRAKHTRQAAALKEGKVGFGNFLLVENSQKNLDCHFIGQPTASKSTNTRTRPPSTYNKPTPASKPHRAGGPGHRARRPPRPAAAA